MATQGKAHTLQPTALLNEAYLRLTQAGAEGYRDRKHFLLAASLAMRHVLVDYYRSKTRQRRPQGRVEWDLSQMMSPYEERIGDLDALDRALADLAQRDEQSAKLIELRFFGGLTMGEIAEVLDIPPRRLEARWQTLRAWLKLRLG